MSSYFSCHDKTLIYIYIIYSPNYNVVCIYYAKTFYHHIPVLSLDRLQDAAAYTVVVVDSATTTFFFSSNNFDSAFIMLLSFACLVQYFPQHGSLHGVLKYFERLLLLL